MSFEAAVLDPFSKNAEGARVPDWYSFPTETKTFKFKFPVRTCDSSMSNFGDLWYIHNNVANPDGVNPIAGGINFGNSNSIDFTFKPSIVESVIFPKATNGCEGMNIGGLLAVAPVVGGDIQGSSGTYRDSSPTVVRNQLTRLAGNIDAFEQLRSTGFIDESFANQVSKYRLVGGGVRVSSLMPPEKSTGWFNLFSAPCSKTDLTQLEFISHDATAANNVRTVRNNTSRPYIVDPVTPLACMKLSSAMSEEPTGAVLDHYQFNSKGLEYAFRPMSPDAFNWRSPAAKKLLTGFDGAGRAIDINTDVIETETGLVVPVNGDINRNAKGYQDTYYDCAGWSFMSLSGTNLPGTSGTAGAGGGVPIAVIELIYHIEYVSSEIGITSTAKFSPIYPGMLDRVMFKAAVLPMYRQLYSGASSGTKIKRKLGF